MALAKVSFQIPSHVYLFLDIKMGIFARKHFFRPAHSCQMAHFPALIKHLAKFTDVWPHICQNEIKLSIENTQVEILRIYLHEMPPCAHCTYIAVSEL